MKTSQVRFEQLQRDLKQIGFAESRDPKGWRFEHSPSNTVFLFRPYRPSDWVYEHDLFLVHSQLQVRGLVAEEAFSDSPKTPA